VKKTLVAMLLVLALPLISFTALANAQVEINVLFTDWFENNWAEYVKLFEAENPDVKVNVQGFPFRNLFEVIEVKMQSKATDVDVIGVDVPLVASYAIRDYLLPLNDYFTEDDMSVWLPAARESAFYNGQLLAPPLRTSSAPLYYNKDIFEEAGIEFPPSNPDERWTWEKTLEVARQLTKRDANGVTEVWGLAFYQVNRPYQILPLPQSLGGGSGISEDGFNVQGYLTNEEWIEAMEFYRDLFNKYAVSPKGVIPEEMHELFGTGKVAMYISGESGVVTFANNYPDLNFGVSYHPYFADGEAVTPTGSWHIGVSKNTKNAEAAARFVKFLTTDPRVAKAAFKDHGYLVPNVELFSFTDEELEAMGYPADAFRLLEYELNNTAVSRPQTPGYLEWEDILSGALEDIRNGADPEDTLKNAEYRLQRLLNRYTR